MPPRYALYAVPAADTPLGAFGTRWLGRNAETGEDLPFFDVPGFTEDALRELTETPRRYGFHATLKQPMPLAPSCDAEELADAARRLADGIAPVPIPSLAVRRIGAFLAIVPHLDSPALNDLAARVVIELDRFRAPPGAAELARRRQATLTPRQDELLGQWGYPYVLDEFRCHFTLTGQLGNAVLPRLQPELEHLAAPALGATVIEDIALCVEDGAGQPFRLVDRFPLRGVRA